jgi:hypothetical protein
MPRLNMNIDLPSAFNGSERTKMPCLNKCKEDAHPAQPPASTHCALVQNPAPTLPLPKFEALLDFDHLATHSFVQQLIRDYLQSFIDAVSLPHSTHCIHKIHGILSAAVKNIYKMFLFTLHMPVTPCHENTKVHQDFMRK